MAKLAAIILAAGEGTRMKSLRPKVLHELAGRTLIDWVLAAAKSAGADPRVVVVGHQAKAVAAALPAGVRTARQQKPLGTAHALASARSQVAALGGDLLVLCGDAPLIEASTLRQLVREHRRRGAAATVLTACLPEPFGYGRIVRAAGDQRQVARIVEEKDATPEERLLTEVNSGAYCFSQAQLWPALRQVGNRNRKHEFYLTDVIAALQRAGRVVAAVRAQRPAEVLGINSRADLAQAAYWLNCRTLTKLMDSGVTIFEPEQVWIEPQVRIGRDTVVLGGTRILGASRIGSQCRLGPGAYIDSTRLGSQVSVKLSVLEHCQVADHVRIGPFFHLRGGTRVGAKAYIGNYAEANRSRIGPHTKLGHVCYVGDATIGGQVNIGAGTITANFDGRSKHPTRIGDNAFIGSGTVIVAPATIGAGALTGAGAVLKHHSRIPAGMVAVGVPARVIKKRKP